MEAKTRDLVVNIPGAITWIADSNHFWYGRTVKGGTEFILVDATQGAKRLAFDHDKLAAAISTVTGQKFTGLTLPFVPGRRAAPSTLQFYDRDRSIRFAIGGVNYSCHLSDYTCSKNDAVPPASTGADAPLDPEGPGGDPVDGLEYQPPAPQVDGGEAGRTARRDQTPCAPRARNSEPRRRPAGRVGMGQQFPGQLPPEPPEVCASSDGKWEAFIQNYNVFLKPVGKNEPAVPLSSDGSEGNYYTLRSVAWSPDSRKLAAYHTRPGYDRQVHYIESSPADQLQPKHTTISYRKPGDALDIAYPALFDIATRHEIEIDHALFPNAYNVTTPVWWKDSRAFTFEYNQRGHQVYRVIEVDAKSGAARSLITEESKTFIYYDRLAPGLSGGRRYRRDLHDGHEIIWASERDGWEHLYLYDGLTGQVKAQITKGSWLVRNVHFVDEDKRQVYFDAGGMVPGQDPYFTQCYRINFDGTGLTRLTRAEANHSVAFSADHLYYVDTWQRVDLPPVAELHQTADQKLVMELEKADDTAVRTAGFKYPEVFVAKGRDGQTDIWGIITRPLHFDPARK